MEQTNMSREQLCLFESVSDSDHLSLTLSVSERKHAAIQRFLHRAEKETQACVTKYSPGKRKSEYYRLSYRQGKKIRHIHIKGGSAIAELATYRAVKIQELIDRGADLEEVIAMTRTFNGARFR
jgi:hypothetical protein